MNWKQKAAFSAAQAAWDNMLPPDYYDDEEHEADPNEGLVRCEEDCDMVTIWSEYTHGDLWDDHCKCSKCGWHEVERYRLYRPRVSP